VGDEESHIAHIIEKFRHQPTLEYVKEHCNDFENYKRALQAGVPRKLANINSSKSGPPKEIEDAPPSKEEMRPGVDGSYI